MNGHELAGVMSAVLSANRTVEVVFVLMFCFSRRVDDTGGMGDFILLMALESLELGAASVAEFTCSIRSPVSVFLLFCSHLFFCCFSKILELQKKYFFSVKTKNLKMSH